MRLSILFVVVIIFSFSQGKRHKKSAYVNRDPEEEWLEKWNGIADQYLNDEEFRLAVALTNRNIKRIEADIASGEDPRGPPLDVYHLPFNCDLSIGVSPSVPTSVHALRPGDIKVIGALGDSITAGNGVGAEEVLGVALENRGESWSVGSDFKLEENVTTIANILLKYEPNLKGSSECASQESNFHYAWFNQARPGAKADDMPTGARKLIDYMKNDTRVNLQEDWKMITLFVGGNDLCGYCDDPDYHSAANYVNFIKNALDMLHAELPRTFVNLVPMADVSPVHSVYFHYNGTDGYLDEPEWDRLYPWMCELFHLGFCSCVMNETGRVELRQVQLDYFYGLEELVNSRRYDTHDQFTVVLQPHLKDQVAMIDPVTGLTDNRYFAPDCFHPNRRMHQLFAYMLWNVMLIPVGEKPVAADPNDWPTYLCPTAEKPYLFTHMNSIELETDTACNNIVTSGFVIMTTLCAFLFARI